MKEELRVDHLPKPYAQMVNSIRLYGNPFDTSNEERNKLLVETKKRGKLLYYTGCMASIRYKKVAELTARVLSKLGYDFAMLGGDEICCGGILSMLGLEDEFKEVAKSNLKRIQKSQAKKVITACPMCLKTMRYDYEELGMKAPFEVMHISELIAKAIKKGLKFKNSVSIKALYHDPCHLGRACGIYEEPREILKKITGLNYLEIPFFNKEESLCCGGFLRPAFPNLATAINELVFLETKELNIDSIVTSCPTCLHNFSVIAPEFNLQVYELTELIAVAIGIVRLEEIKKF
ncbi:MAG: (Fe-S)-binding protein [Candidatus Bathyarchaeia archaeon]